MSKTTVCNCKVAYIRPEYENLKDCLSHKKNVYIGRKGIVFIDKERFPKKDSVWANPYKADKDGTLKEVLKKYEKYIRKKIIDENLDINELSGNNLYCWCVDKPTRYNPKNEDKIICHGQILLKILNEQNSPKKEEDSDRTSKKVKNDESSDIDRSSNKKKVLDKKKKLSGNKIKNDTKSDIDSDSDSDSASNKKKVLDKKKKLSGNKIKNDTKSDSDSDSDSDSSSNKKKSSTNKIRNNTKSYGNSDGSSGKKKSSVNKIRNDTKSDIESDNDSNSSSEKKVKTLSGNNDSDSTKKSLYNTALKKFNDLNEKDMKLIIKFVRKMLKEKKK